MAAPDAAMTANVEPENLSRMIASVAFNCGSHEYSLDSVDDTNFPHWPIAGCKFAVGSGSFVRLL
jgi:hypothetical protein